MYVLDDTIVAIATAPGAAGLAVVRLSGTDALSIADGVFRGRSKLGDAGANTLHHGWALRPNGGTAPERDRPPIDEVVAAVFRAPYSYTREDVVELSCHGGRIASERVLSALIDTGARLAKPGEFTLRAFLNGRLDLVQAEAVADVIHAETGAAHDLALSQLAGELSRMLDGFSERIMEALAEIEARVDFAEDVGGIEVPSRVVDEMLAIGAELRRMLDSSPYARAVREGIRVPLVGRPNVGKSSLFNALVGEDRAIVTALPGTTRDRISESIEIAGVRVTLSDTAGLRDPRESVEAIGIERAERALEESRIVLWVVDGSVAIEDMDREIARRLDGKRLLVAINKRDLGSVVKPAEIERLLAGSTRSVVVSTSVTADRGLDEVRRGLLDLLDLASGNAAMAAANPRHADALERAHAALVRGAAAGQEGAPGEIVALELRESLSALGEVSGKSVSEDLLERIFSRFCIGK